MEVAINFGSILVAACIFYFVIKHAVKSGINASMLFTDEQRCKKQEQEWQEVSGALDEVNTPKKDKL